MLHFFSSVLGINSFFLQLITLMSSCAFTLSIRVTNVLLTCHRWMWLSTTESMSEHCDILVASYKKITSGVGGGRKQKKTSDTFVIIRR